MGPPEFLESGSKVTVSNLAGKEVFETTLTQKRDTEAFCVAVLLDCLRELRLPDFCAQIDWRFKA